MLKLGPWCWAQQDFLYIRQQNIHICSSPQVQVGDKTSTGSGPNKKLAKRNAAEAMLQLLGYSRPSPQPGKPAIKSADSQVSMDK